MDRKSEHSHILICGLIYPAILGAIIYNFYQGYKQISPIQLFLVITLTVHFTFDFLFTADEEAKRIYNPIRALLDTGLTIFTFIAIDRAIQTYFPVTLQDIWICLVLFKSFSLLWEFAGKKTPHWFPAAITHFVFAIVYGLGWMYFSDTTAYFLVVILVDISVSIYWYTKPYFSNEAK